MIKDADGNQWERSCKDLPIYHVLQDMFYKIKEVEGLNFLRKGGVTYVTR
jgi:hypothetical protein